MKHGESGAPRRRPLWVCDMVATTARRIGSHYALHLRQIGLTFPMLQVLAELHRKDGQKPGILAERMAARGSSMTELLDRLAEQGFIERVADLRDRRALRVHLTEEGRAHLRQALEVVARFNRNLSRKLSHSEMEAFSHVIGAITELTGDDSIMRFSGTAS